METYICENCGKEHEGWPALGFSFPDYYGELTEEEKSTIATLSNDFCVITHPDQTDRFIRATLDIPVINNCQTIQYGVWVSLSEKSFNNYKEHFNDNEYEEGYFGYLCNYLPHYEKSTLSIHTDVLTRRHNQRPEIIPHRSYDHPLVVDYYEGITLKEALRRLQILGAEEIKPKYKFWQKGYWFGSQ